MKQLQGKFTTSSAMWKEYFLWSNIITWFLGILKRCAAQTQWTTSLSFRNMDNYLNSLNIKTF